MATTTWLIKPSHRMLHVQLLVRAECTAQQQCPWWFDTPPNRPQWTAIYFSDGAASSPIPWKARSYLGCRMHHGFMLGPPKPWQGVNREPEPNQVGPKNPCPPRSDLPRTKPPPHQDHWCFPSSGRSKQTKTPDNEGPYQPHLIWLTLHYSYYH